MIKDADEQSDEETQGKVWKSSEWRGFGPHGAGCATFPAHRCVHQPGSSMNPVLTGFLLRLHHEDMIND